MLDEELAEAVSGGYWGFKSSGSKEYKTFPSDFMFQLTEQEWANLKSQIEISS